MTAASHIPVLLPEAIAALERVEGGVFVDGTFGGGGYAKALLAAGAARVIAIDRDPSAVSEGRKRISDPRLSLVEGRFSDLDALAIREGANPVDGVVLDIGVSTMQVDRAERGFSFMRDGPLDMRMELQGSSAADLVNGWKEEDIADVLHHYGEERAARRIARAIVAARRIEPITQTARLARIVADALPPGRKGRTHPATRSFQALRIAVNDELGQLARALFAAERLLRPGGRLAVVTFHSLEDRIVKRYLQTAGGRGGRGSRHRPERRGGQPRFDRPAPPVAPATAEVARNPRARSARLRSATRTAAAPAPLDAFALGLPRIADAPQGMEAGA